MMPGIADLKLTQHKGLEMHLEATRNFNAPQVRRAAIGLLRAFGIDHTEDENFKGTPDRFTKMWGEWLSPKNLKMAVFASDTNGAVIISGHKTVSVCPHHLLPFHMEVDVAYVPNQYVVGLSKLPRLVDIVASSFALQEHIPDVVVKILSALLTPRGVICRTRAKHGCMRLRGVRTPATCTTTAVQGVFLTDEKARHEFLGEAWNK
jgi:GTP cyclohydrolase I